MKSIRQDDAVVLVDAGDIFGNAGALTTLEERLAGEFLLRGMAMMDYDAVTLGEEEFRFGEGFLAEQLTATALAATSANLYRQSDDQPYVAQTFTTTAGGITVGIVGLLGDGFRQQVEATSGVDGEGVIERAMLDHIGDAVAALGPVDVVVLLAHTSLATARELAQVVTGVDVMVVGHDKAAPASPERFGELRLVTAGYDGKWVGRLRLEVVDGAIVSDDWDGPALDSGWADDPDLAALYQEYLERLASAADEIVDSIPQEVPDGGSYVGKAGCGACHPIQAGFWPTTRHAQAMTTLVATHHDFSPPCLPCHTTGFGYVGGFLLPDRTPDRADVQCEMCHGAAHDHEAEPVPGYGLVSTEVCTEKCHTPDHSPDFDLDERLAEVRCPTD